MSSGLTHHKKVWYAPNKFEAYGEEEIKAVEECLRDGWLAPGPRTAKFEQQIADKFGKKHGIMVNSGSSANMLGLCVAGIGPGDEVVTPACTFSTTIAPIVQLGATPVFCDVELNKYVASVEAVMACVTPKTKVIMLPNLVGSKPDYKGIRAAMKAANREDIILFEDSADTITHSPETDIAITSFYASHIITAGGGGGMVMFNTEEHIKRAFMFRDWGRIGNNSEDMSERFNHSVDGIPYDFKFLYGCLGYNFKSCEMNAAFGLVQLQKFDKYKIKRRTNVKRYIQTLTGVLPGLELPADKEIEDMDEWLACPFTYTNRQPLLEYLENHGIQTRVCFAGNVTRHPAYRQYLKEFKNADTIMKDGFLLGAHHGLDVEDIDFVCNVIKAYKPEEHEK